MSGVIGREPEWQAAEAEWLRRTQGEVFHAADCEHNRNLDLYKDLTLILAGSRLAGRAVALDLIALKEFFPTLSPEFGYYKCFIMMVNWLVDNTAAQIGEPIEFTFDSRRESDYNAEKLYSVLSNKPKWSGAQFMRGKISFATRTNPRIQMADLVAREAMKDLNNSLGPVQRPRRKSISTLFTEGHFSFGVIDREYCSKWKESSDLVPELADQYNRWLLTHKLADNMSNRIDFMAWLNSKNALTPETPATPGGR